MLIPILDFLFQMFNVEQLKIKITDFYMLLYTIRAFLEQSTSNFDRTISAFLAINYQLRLTVQVKCTPKTFAMLSIIIDRLALTQQAELIAYIICQIRLHYETRMPHIFLHTNFQGESLVLSAQFIYQVLKYHDLAQIVPNNFSTAFHNLGNNPMDI
jgi:hypothetical protein